MSLTPEESNSIAKFLFTLLLKRKNQQKIFFVIMGRVENLTSSVMFIDQKGETTRQEQEIN